MKNKLIKAFTLSELVVVMLVIAVVVAVSIKITKTKFDVLISYTYYSAFNTIKTVTGEIMAGYVGEDRSQADIEHGCTGLQYWNETTGTCINRPASLPQNGTKFCEMFLDSVNIKDGDCTGAGPLAITTAANNSDFSNLEPDIVLKNGIKLYNVHNDPTNIAQLRDNEPIAMNFSDYKVVNSFNINKITNIISRVFILPSYAYEDDNLNFNNLPSRGYTVYADVNGDSGDSVLYEDVFPFYITLSGTVVPAFDSNIEAGGNSKSELEVSLSYDDYTTGSRVKKWILKSVSFQEAACTAGYVRTGFYCSGINVDAKCQNQDANCQLVIIKPLRN